MKTLFIITGAVCSGKSTLAKKISESFNLPLFNEELYGNLENSINELNNCNLDYAIIEHCDILNFLKELKQYNKKIFVLKVNNKLLKEHFNSRVKSGATGDYLKINPVKQQEQILNLSNQIDVINIETSSDYEIALSKISKSVSLRLPKQIKNSAIKNNLALKQTKQFKDKYFDYYDDVKSNTHEVYDWWAFAIKIYLRKFLLYIKKNKFLNTM